MRHLAPVLLACFALFPISEENKGSSSMRKLDETPFYVAGYAVRTNNADELSGRGRIGDLWQRFQQENLAAAIPDRVDGCLIAVYSDYASDEKGEFSYLLGARVSSARHLPAQLSYRRVIAGPYAIFTTEQGPLVQVLQQEWRKIWSAGPNELGGVRAFATDYEVYDQRAADREHAQIEIHIGVKPMPVATPPARDFR